ncbi:Eco57I restriction-modification methylase domain-containing protein [Prevotella conceptionensis]|uniref:Eco57I restriction-modification methylase domain-containing protein n=1 Tax=Prevotella conceptionensis TaxID=340486 RepID=UPI00030BE663|nr:N-6 DNA methylase [Prevotella conceptionensis]
MNTDTLSIEALKGYLSSQYKGWNSFVDNVIFPIFGKDKFETLSETELLENSPEEKPLAEATGICSIKQVGQIDIGVQPLQIFDVTVSDRVMMERNRVNIQRLIRKVMENYSSAFMLFHYENDTRWDWRFTFCHKKGSQKEVTDSKRYTFLLGPGQSCRTAAENFIKLYENRDTLDMSKIEGAFSVEALTNEFFGKYKEEYDKFVEYITGKRYVKRDNKYVEAIIHEPHPTLYSCFSNNDKLVRDYVKKMLGRIVFLHFLQKKGWLGVPYNEEWGNGDRNFMLNLFKNATEKQKENFLDEVLEGLFAEGLDCNRAEKSDLYDTKVEGLRKCRIPYLNGGLFERDYLDELAVRFPAEYFDSLLTMLSLYNFTIDENDPNDAEVGVDPEMLGRIFENLLEDNKDKGAFYTPKEIVQYMCRESLIAYLQTDQNEEDKENIRKFVTTHDAELLGDLKADIEQKLLDVKICDPAIGSGAFPMGLLRELFFCRSAIEPNIIENAANIKRYIIQNNIYGVDIERGAVDIARLRFWLALIVDEKTPEALPNLDFKIMQGNSLLEQYKGVDLSTMTEKKVGAGQSITIFDSMLDVYRKNLRDKLAEYYACPEHDKKVQLRKEIADIVKQELVEQGIHIDFEDMDLSANSQFFLWHTWFHDVFSRPSKEGFDIVIGNPPYLESRSPNFPESLKVSLQSEIQKRRLSDARAFPRGADLLIFFYELSLRLLSPNGYNVFITENSWLSTDYGKLFQNFLLKKCKVHAIIDSEYKYFETADINTIITIIRNRNESNDKFPVKFFHCNGSLEKYPCNTFSMHDTENVTLKEFLSSAQLLHNYKWGVIIRAEQKLLRIIETISQLKDKSLSSKISIGQGLNLTKSHIVYSQSSRTYPYYTSEIGPTYSWNNSSCYVSKDDISSSRKKPLLIMPRGIGTHFCSINECSGYTSSYVEIYGDLSQEETLNIWLFCNSSLFWLLREITGRTNLGGGMLKAEATDLKSIPICYNFNKPSEIFALYMTVKDKVIDTSILATLNDNQHKMIDAIVLKFFGLGKEEAYIVNTLQDMVFRRMKKSKTK